MHELRFPIGIDVRFRNVFRCSIFVALTTTRSLDAHLTDAAQSEYARGVTLQQNGDLLGAKKAYEAALKLSPKRVDVLSNLGLVYGQLDEYGLAVQTFRRALSVDPNQPVVRFNLALTYMQSEQFENAGRELRTLLPLQPENNTVRYMLGLAELKTGDFPHGIAHLEKARTDQPQNVELACTLTSAYIKTKQFKQAAEVVETTLLKSDTAEAHFLAGSYYLASGDYRSSLQHLQRAHALNPDLPELESSLADAYALTGNQDVAAAMFEQEVRDRPQDYTANAFLGWLYLEAHDTERASAHLERARRVKPDDPDLLFQLARLARLQGREAQAATLLERVVSAKPRYAPAHVLLAQAYLKLRRADDASRERAIVKQLNAEEQSRQVASENR